VEPVAVRPGLHHEVRRDQLVEQAPGAQHRDAGRRGGELEADRGARQQAELAEQPHGRRVEAGVRLGQRTAHGAPVIRDAQHVDPLAQLLREGGQ
jgi:hypothetical protein